MMKNLLAILSMIAFTPLCHAAKTPMDVYCAEWENYCNTDGSGIYFEIIDHIYSDQYQLAKHVFPYKRAIAMGQRGGTLSVVLGSYKGEVSHMLYPTLPDAIDTISAIMLVDKVPSWDNVHSLSGARVLLTKNWSLSKFLDAKFEFYEVENIYSAIPLLQMKRYDYFLTEEHQDTVLPKNMASRPLIDIPTYPAFSQTAEGLHALNQWDTSIVNMFNSGTLLNIYSKYHKEKDFQGELESIYKHQSPKTN